MDSVLAICGPKVYYLYMASIVGKKQGGHTYYYLVESARVAGKPRIVSQRYLGSAEEIDQRLSASGPGEPPAPGTSPSGTWRQCGRFSSASG